MQAQILKLSDLVRRSFWFLPTIMMLCGLLLFIGTLLLDHSSLGRGLANVSWVYTGGVGGARRLLGVLAGAMVAIGTVVFSTMTLVLTLATSQFGHRLIRSFMRNTVNQMVLGTFVATFIYLTLVLHMVGDNPTHSFVPHISITVGFALAVVSTLGLVYFTHHIAEMIAAPKVIATVGTELDQVIRRMYPHASRDAESAEESGLPPATRFTRGPFVSVKAYTAGYVQTISIGDLIDVAVKYDCVLEVVAPPGEYVFYDSELARFYSAEQTEEAPELGHEAGDRVRANFGMGTERTPMEDLIFATNQLTEIATRALSPALNDPFTALDCINRLGAGLARLARRPMPSPLYSDDKGNVRLIMTLPDFSDMLDSALIPIRTYGRNSLLTTRELLKVIEKLARITQRRETHKALRRHAEVILDGVQTGLPEEEDRQMIQGYYRAALQALRSKAGGEKMQI